MGVFWFCYGAVIIVVSVLSMLALVIGAVALSVPCSTL